MKNIIVLVSIIYLVSCNNKPQEYLTSKGAKGTIPRNTFELQGVWGLTNYLDSIVSTKQIAKHRLLPPTWSAFLLDFSEDSLQTFGSITLEKMAINNKSDTIALLSSEVSGERWWLIKDTPYLTLTSHSSNSRIDNTKYIYRKRKDLNNLLIENGIQLENNIIQFFNSQLIKGGYMNTQTKDTIHFNNDKPMTKNNYHYNIRSYFGTYHPYKNLDVLYLRNDSTVRFKEYNWIFNQDTLLLTNFTPEPIILKDTTVLGDDFILGHEGLVFKKI